MKVDQGVPESRLCLESCEFGVSVDQSGKFAMMIEFDAIFRGSDDSDRTDLGVNQSKPVTY